MTFYKTLYLKLFLSLHEALYFVGNGTREYQFDLYVMPVILSRRPFLFDYNNLNLPTTSHVKRGLPSTFPRRSVL